MIVIVIKKGYVTNMSVILVKLVNDRSITVSNIQNFELSLESPR